MAAAAVHLAAAATAVMLLLLAAEAVDVADVVGTLQQQLELARTWQHAQMQNRRVKMYVYDLPSQFHSAGARECKPGTRKLCGGRDPRTSGHASAHASECRSAAGG